MAPQRYENVNKKNNNIRRRKRKANISSTFLPPALPIFRATR
jgi:hypothetical protein